ncbi:MAG: hypothetical protein JST00_26575 [Deltaproteobacteria bacterium]|nr:hypothetical protein [Deltaproteobacteria bacterium]
MKCIRCQNDSKYSERTDGKCPRCNGRFAFEPKSGDTFTDAAFAAAIDRVSSSDAVRFTEANLYYELARTRRRSNETRLVLFILAVIVFAVGAVIAMSSTSGVVFLVALALAAGAGIAGALTKPRPVPSLTRSDVSEMLRKWTAAHGAPAKLVQPPKAPARARPAPVAKELATYSFDRAVICDRPETVDLLLANNFHFENNCAILSVTRYPEALFEPVLEMLRKNPRIEVYALHDASADNHDLARTLATSPQWFRGIGRVTDVGLLARHAMKMRGLWQALPMTKSVTFPDVTAAERAWLSTYVQELAAIRPEQVIKRLFRAMTQPGTQVATGDGGFYFIGGSFGGPDAGTSDGGGDSFG